MNFAAIKTEVGQSLPSDASDRLGLWVNWAVEDLLSRTRWSWLEVSPVAVALVASQQTYQLAGAAPVVTDFAGMIDVSLEVSTGGFREKMIEVTPQDFDFIAGGSRANGVPRFYTVIGGVLPTTGSANILSGGLVNLNVWPLPLATAGNGQGLLIRYYRNTDSMQLTATTDVPIAPVSLHPAIVQLAIAIGLSAYDQENEAQSVQMRAEALIAHAISTDLAYRNGDATVYQLKPRLITPQAGPLGPNEMTQHGTAQAQ